MTDKKQYVLVTGGGQGIGRAVALAFAGRGWDVAIFERDGEAREEARAEVAAAGADCLVYGVDVSDEQAVAGACEDLAGRGVSLGALINNAGISGATPLDAPLAAWDAVIAINLRGPYVVVKYALPLLAAGAAIVNIASTRALMSEPDWHAYDAAKGGLLALTRSLAVTLGGRRIRVNAISPGWIDTSMLKKGRMRRPTALRPVDHEQHPAGRVGRPEDIAAACLFLASPDAGFITGANLVVDGGMTIKMIYEE
jgi:NAD(P)-dependent dehydrogenase (short-subunit alcohol dehydrogenase family)